MNTAYDSTRLVDDLAGHWTDPALEILKASGVAAVSVDMELETWRTLRRVLQSDLRQPPESVDALKASVLRKATFQVARKFAPARALARVSRRTDSFPRLEASSAI